MLRDLGDHVLVACIYSHGRYCQMPLCHSEDTSLPNRPPESGAHSSGCCPERPGSRWDSKSGDWRWPSRFFAVVKSTISLTDQCPLLPVPTWRGLSLPGRSARACARADFGSASRHEAWNIRQLRVHLVIAARVVIWMLRGGVIDRAEQLFVGLHAWRGFQIGPAR